MKCGAPAALPASNSPFGSVLIAHFGAMAFTGRVVGKGANNLVKERERERERERYLWYNNGSLCFPVVTLLKDPMISSPFSQVLSKKLSHRFLIKGSFLE